MKTNYKILVLAPVAGGKTTLTRYLRENTDYEIAETDEEVVKANGGTWPQDNVHKDTVLLPKTFREVVSRKNVIFFAKDITVEQLQEAKEKGFKIILLNLSAEELHRRNKKRMKEEGYNDLSMWFPKQLEQYEEFKKLGLIDEAFDGTLPVQEIVDLICDDKERH